MHRNDLDRHVDNMDDYRRIEIMSKDNERTVLKPNRIGKLIAYALFALILFLILKLRFAG